MKKFASLICVLLLARIATAQSTPGAASKVAPFPYVWASATHVLPETHTDESGYFSIVEGHNGKIYVGTAKYNYNAFLVEFDPRSGVQKIVIDTNKVNGLSATGYASQSKIHTRNFVGASGKIYVGSQEGYRAKGDASQYPGGYVMTYDPLSGQAQSLGMPMPGEGVIDVVADEARGNLYVVTSWGEDAKSHWLIGDIATKTYRSLGVLPTNYASTLMDEKGRAHVLTSDFQLATYDPKTKSVSTRAIEIEGENRAAKTARSIPTWQLAPDKKSAYLIWMNDPSLIQIPLDGKAGSKNPVKAKVLAQMLKGKNFDSRSALSVAPDGRVYALVRADNESGFGRGYLHHITRYDPKRKFAQDVGVLAIKNPTFFDFGPREDGTKPPWSHGYHTLPDGTLTPLHMHQGLIAARDGNLYALILYPYTILKIEGVSTPAPIAAWSTPGRTASNRAAKRAPLVGTFAMPARRSPSQQYAAFVLNAMGRVEKNLPEITRVAELVADRHIAGGAIGFPWNGQSLQQELAGRAGGLMNIDFARVWKNRAPEGNAHNVAIIGWDRAPTARDLAQLQKLKTEGAFIIGLGGREMPEIADHIKLCDAFFDSGLGADDRVVTLPGGALNKNSRVGRGNALANALNGWAFTGELIAALTRKGKMPPIWKAFLYPDGREWMAKYFGQVQFHDDFSVAPIAPEKISRAFLGEMRANIKRFEISQSAHIAQAADMIAAEMKAGRKTIVATQGHAPWTYAGKYEDAQWGIAFDVDAAARAQMETFEKTAPDGALVLRLGYSGMNAEEAELFKGKNQRVILITATSDPRAEYKIPAHVPLVIDLGWEYGDAIVSIAGYPIKVLPPSGIMQIVAYESVNAEVLARLNAPLATANSLIQ